MSFARCFDGEWTGIESVALIDVLCSDQRQHAYEIVVLVCVRTRTGKRTEIGEVLQEDGGVRFEVAHFQNFGVHRLVARQVGYAVRLQIRFEFHSEEIVGERRLASADELLMRRVAGDHWPALTSERRRVCRADRALSTDRFSK